MLSNAYITAVAAFLPGKPIANDEMEATLGMVGSRPSRARRVILRSNGIEARYYAIDRATGKPSHNNAQITAEAVRLLESDSFSVKQIDCLACGTTMADQLMPNHASMVHGELGMAPCEIVSTAGVCVSGVTALKYAFMGVKTGEFKHAVATGSEIPSSLMRAKYFQEELDAKVAALEARPEIAFEKDFLRWMLSDGSGAVLVQPQASGNGLSLRIDWINELSYANEQAACMYAGAEKQHDGSLRGWRDYEPQAWLDQSVFTIKQDVKQLNEHVMHYTVERGMIEMQKRHNLKPEAIDYFLPHYSSGYFREKVLASLVKAGFEIPYERWFTNLATKGNTGSASMYIMLEELFHSGALKAGQHLLCYVPESGRFSTAFVHLTVCGPGAA